MSIIITGDKHGDFRVMLKILKANGYSKGSTVIIAGDAGLNYYGDGADDVKKAQLNDSGYTFFCIHGNHENRPENIESYKVEQFNGGNVYVEEAYPNVKFAQDGEIYRFDNKSLMVLGGAYSVDKQIRLENNWNWFPDEQMSDENKEKAIKKLDNCNWNVDIVVSHTCPYDYRPIEMFMSGIDQSKVDSSMEEWLQEIESKLNYEKWYCGHWHTDKTVDKISFLYHNIKTLK